MLRTKIVCTLGPASGDMETIRAFAAAGMAMARINFSHGTHQEHAQRIKMVRQVAKEIGCPIAVLADLQGPKLRVGLLPEEGVQLIVGETITLLDADSSKEPGTVPIPHPEVLREVEPGDRILLDDGLLELKVQSKDEHQVQTSVVTEGVLTSRKGISLPHTSIKMPSVTEKDQADARFAVEQEADYFALSFVRSPEDVSHLRAFLAELGSQTPIISKIEKPEAVDCIEEILTVSDGMMVARGDLGVEAPAEEVPIIQKKIIHLCNRASKPVITATQMLDSMIRNPRPTRAEASDVANAILDGSDAIMLSGETAVGSYALQSVQTMARIAQVTERSMPYQNWLHRSLSSGSRDVTEAFSQVATEIAAQSGRAQLPLLPARARPATTPFLERADRLPLVGRQKELAELLCRVEAAVAGGGGLTVLYGEAGVGKSRLLRELAENVRWRGVHVLWGRCYELAAPPAYQPLLEALRSGLPALARSVLPSLWRAELSRLLPELATGEGPPPSLAKEEERRRLLEAIARGFLALAEAGCQLVLLEDVHWMDLASLEALRYLLPRLGDVAVRPEELAPPVARVLSAMEGTRLPRPMSLERLTPAETEELVKRALNLERAAPRFSARLHAETEGNPFFVVETLRTLVEEGLLFRDEGGVWSTPWDESTQDYAELPLPVGVMQSIERRLARLPAALTDLLNLAATIGRWLDFRLWLAASGREEEELLAAGDELCARGLFVVTDPALASGADYAFAHDLIRRVTCERLSGPRRRLYHRRVAEALTRLPHGAPPTTGRRRRSGSRQPSITARPVTGLGRCMPTPRPWITTARR